MIVSIAIAVLPVCRSPMISSRWPRPIGVMASMALMPVCSGSLTGWTGAITDGACSSSWRVARCPRSGPCRPAASPSGSDHAAQEGVADRHRQHLAGAPDLLALLDLAEVAQDHDADLARRPGSAPGRACRPRTPAARWPWPRAGPRPWRCRRRTRRRCRPPPRRRFPARSPRRNARARPGSRPAGLSAPPSSSRLPLCPSSASGVSPGLTWRAGAGSPPAGSRCCRRSARPRSGRSIPPITRGRARRSGGRRGP